VSMEIREHGADVLSAPEYGRIPIRYRVESTFRIEPVDGGLGGLSLREERVDEPYDKDYDEGNPAARFQRWHRWDLSNWRVFLARSCGRDGGDVVGGAVVAFNTDGVHLLEGRKDLAVLWDIRVRPKRRRQGIGAELLRRAADWARGRGCTRLKIETQNVNVPACRFYASQGCHLGGMNCYGYEPGPCEFETVLMWYLDL